MVSDLTTMDIANASLLDEATAAAEAMTLAKRSSKSKSNIFFIDQNCFNNTINVLKTRALPLGIDIKLGRPEEADSCDYFGILLQYPGSDGRIANFEKTIKDAHGKDGLVVFACDLLALTLLKSPGELGADIVVGSSQRFGVPLGCGGPHAAFIAVNENLKRSLPGRIVGVSVDSSGDLAYRLALQTREQHIRREKATSNICTAQALLAIMAGFYAIYHGPEGLKQIARNVNHLTKLLAQNLKENGFELLHESFFDTLTVSTKDKTKEIIDRALSQECNLRIVDDETLGVSLDETSSLDDVMILLTIFLGKEIKIEETDNNSFPKELIRKTSFLTHPVFSNHQTETEMLRYVRRLCDKDIALDRAMIPLGSCTMKLNATSEMIPVSWPEFSQIHPFAPKEQLQGYEQLISEIESMLADLTGYSAISIQPNAGSQGEYAGLLAIDAFHKDNGDNERNICLIPKSAHGTNPASAQMVGLKVVPIECDDQGNIDLKDLRDKAEKAIELEDWNIVQELLNDIEMELEYANPFDQYEDEEDYS